jgi:hypothetical protein
LFFHFFREIFIQFFFYQDFSLVSVSGNESRIIIGLTLRKKTHAQSKWSALKGGGRGDGVRRDPFLTSPLGENFDPQG